MKALTDPLRQRMLEVFCLGPLTTKQLAERLGESPTKLYHHTKLLADAGLIELVETRQNRGTTERYYRAVATQFIVDHKLLSLSPQAEAASQEVQAAIINSLEAGLRDAREKFDNRRIASQAASLAPATSNLHIRTSKDQAARLSKQLGKLLLDLRKAHSEDGEVEFSLTLALFPVKGKTEG